MDLYTIIVGSFAQAEYWIACELALRLGYATEKNSHHQVSYNCIYLLSDWSSGFSDHVTGHVAQIPYPLCIRRKVRAQDYCIQMSGRCGLGMRLH